MKNLQLVMTARQPIPLTDAQRMAASSVFAKRKLHPCSIVQEHVQSACTDWSDVCPPRCSKKWRARFAASSVVSAEKLAEFDSGKCPRCLAICACKRCLVKRSLLACGGPPRFSQDQDAAFALHTLAVLKPHIDDFKAARSAEVQHFTHDTPVAGW